ncbi:MAG: type II toxin-antitoxin system prevent-host-death family antitoxin [Eubacteriales bacterium]|nr:type II toxin-antitoxin system prevent-host-death family antitoxin [Eubacteriales bacterium]
MLATASDLKNNFGKYLRHVIDENGEIIVTKNNTRVARLVPYVSDIERYFTVRENAADYDYNKKTVSYEEFMEIYKKTSTRMEFINGEIIIMESPLFSHQRILGDLYIIFRQYFNSKKCSPFLAPFDVIFRKKDIKDPDVTQPDLIVICDADNLNERGRYMGTPSLTLEIMSRSTRSRDMVYKLNTYMMSGVSEYWIVDPYNAVVVVYAFKDLEIDKIDTYRKGETARSVFYEGLAVEVDSIMPDPVP